MCFKKKIIVDSSSTYYDSNKNKIKTRVKSLKKGIPHKIKMLHVHKLRSILLGVGIEFEQTPQHLIVNLRIS